MDILRQYPFLIPLVVLVLCECTKALIAHVRSGDWQAGIFHPGGIPSTHSAFVTSLLIIVAHTRGLQSIDFAIAFVFAGIVWYDSASVRGAVRDHARVLNELQNKTHLTERLGHTFKEVFAGIAFGAVITELGILIS